MQPNLPKLLIVIPNLGGGGAERVLLVLLRELASRWQVVLVLLEKHIMYHVKLPSGVKYRFLNMKNTLLNFWCLAVRLAQIVREENPDVVFSVLFHANLMTVAAHRLARSGARLVLNAHSPLSYDLARVRLEMAKALAARCLYPLADVIICVSAEVREDLVKNFGVSPALCRVIYNPCDLDHLTRQARSPAAHPWVREKVPVFVAMGRLTPVKNFSLLLRACALARRETPLRLLVLGQGELKERLQREAEALHLEEVVAFLGFQENPFPYLARARALVHSSMQEGLPLVILEAMGLGVPVISTRCFKECNKVVRHGENGLLTPLNDAPALAAALSLLARDEEFALALGRAGRELAEDFRTEKVVARYEDVFCELLKRWYSI